jgi:alanyl-tRNA synthetase
MLGNFSFGDYFKERAIDLAWRLVTREYGLSPDRLTVTVYVDDDEAFGLWRRIAGLPESRIIRIATSDNFWSMGETGPCGPCSEIFYDHGEHIPGGPPGSADAEGDRFIEIWNLVFMQFEQVTPAERVNLPRPSIDTGMGLERISAVLQGTHDNYQTDLFRSLIRAIEEETDTAAEGSSLASHRVIADHLRASSFLIADGVLPSNEGRGYVLRRIMRRAMRHAELLGAREPLMWKLVPALKREMGEAYPELSRAEALIEETLKLEETRFRRTLERGLRMLEEESEDLKPGGVFSGKVAFRLYDTYGFPLDLTQDALKPRGISVDLDAFNESMAKQRQEARRNWAGSGEAATETLWYEIRERVGASDFLGYDTESAEGVVRAIVGEDGREKQVLEKGQSGILVLNQTPFYAEAGGQVGDQGIIRAAGGARFRVTDTQKKLGDLHVHLGRVEEGSIRIDEPVELAVDHDRRGRIRIHHSATHLLHEALRQVLGPHVAQKGSLVEPDRLRFDFSHQKGLSADEIGAVEDIANRVVAQNDEVSTRLMSVDEAIAAGARALFGEKYGEEVRVVTMGVQPGSGNRQIYSMELCGGTHVGRTGDVGPIVVTAEGASAAGVRRIEALAGEAARQHLRARDRKLMRLVELLKTTPADIEGRVTQLVDDRRRLERDLSEARRRLAMGGGSAGGPEPIEVNGIRFMGRVVKGVDPKDLKGLADEGKARLGSGVVALVAVTEDGRAAAVVGVTGDLAGRINAVELVRQASRVLGGTGGGGRPDMAQAGGPDGSRAEAAIEAVRAALG